jgi:HEPN domain-containing protein
MASRSDDWLRQGKRDLDHAGRARDDGDHEWACFAAHQAAEKALKAVYQARGQEAWGHTVSELLASLSGDPEQGRLVDRGKALDKHYIPTRYPNGFPSGAPMDFYTLDDANKAIENAAAIIGFCEDLLRRSGEGPRGAAGAG